MCGVQWASVGTDPWGEGRDLPSLLQQVSLKSRRDSEGVPDELCSLPRKRVDLFSSLRLRKRGLSESEGKEQEAQKEIRTFLSNLKNKGESILSIWKVSTALHNFCIVVLRPYYRHFEEKLNILHTITSL